MACHILGAPNMALKLSQRPPTSVECILKEGASSFMFPKKSIIRFDFPALGTMPPVKLFWHDGLKEPPKIQGVPEGEMLGDIRRARPGGGRGQGRGQGQAQGAAQAPAPGSGQPVSASLMPRVYRARSTTPPRRTRSVKTTAASSSATRASSPPARMAPTRGCSRSRR